MVKTEVGMSSNGFHPLRFTPVYKDYVWGGDAIPRRFRRAAPPGMVAESWELSDRAEGMSVVADGPWIGQTLHALIGRHGADLLGARSTGDRFPLLCKIIDARERLSVQVHPNDADAARYGGEPKSEMWYILDADPGARLFAGLKPGVTRRTFEDAVRSTRMDALLESIPIAAGDAIYIPGGRVHALDRGSLIYEVQQNSNTTYRIYDWGRVGHDGRPRETHLAQALRVIDWKDPPARPASPTPLPSEPGNRRERMVASPYFTMDRLAISAAHEITHDGGSFQVFFCAEGAARVEYDGGIAALPLGVTLLVPASIRAFRILPESGPARLLHIMLP
jgi:mannose-6-phosphate isomerase